MARIFRDLVRTPSSPSRRFIATLTHKNLIHPCPPFHQQLLGQAKFDHGSPRPTEEFAHFSKSQVYPSFSFGFFLDPVPQSGLAPFMPGGVETEHPGMMWADSVKKKRKKKMNKHKYKKLRKRLRRKTKT